MDTAFVVLNALLPLCWLAGFAVGRMDRVASRVLLHGGRRRRPASGRMKARGRVLPETATTALISSYSVHGDRSEGEDIRMRLAPPSRPTGRGSTGSGTAIGGADSGPERPERAVSNDCEMTALGWVPWVVDGVRVWKPRAWPT